MFPVMPQPPINYVKRSIVPAEVLKCRDMQRAVGKEYTKESRTVFVVAQSFMVKT